MMNIGNYTLWLRLIANAASSRQSELKRQLTSGRKTSVGSAPFITRKRMRSARHLALQRILFVGLSLLVAGLPLDESHFRAQELFGGPPTSAAAQRGALSNVRTQVNWLQNATRSASAYASGGADMVFRQFQLLRAAYDAFLRTLNQKQRAQGANELAELSAGLDIIQEAFTNYHDDISAGRATSAAINDLCQILREASSVWVDQLNQDFSRLQIGI